MRHWLRLLFVAGTVEVEEIEEADESEDAAAAAIFGGVKVSRRSWLVLRPPEQHVLPLMGAPSAAYQLPWRDVYLRLLPLGPPVQISGEGAPEPGSETATRLAKMVAMVRAGSRGVARSDDAETSAVRGLYVSRGTSSDPLPQRRVRSHAHVRMNARSAQTV